MSVLCKLGIHRFRTTQFRPLPEFPPKFPAPVYAQVRCMRCGKQDWYFRSNRHA